jgi:glycosyltransferase involved in cell wall biosynthesis
VICFGGEDWWYKNRGHNDMQLMKRFARYGTTLYINSIVMQKPNLKEGKRFFKKLARKIKSIFTGLKKSDAGFWVYSPVSLPFHHIKWAKRLNDWLLWYQVLIIKRKLKMVNPIVWVACPAAADVAIKLNTNKLVYQRTDRYEEYPNVDSETIKGYDQRAKKRADLTIFASRILFDQEAVQCRNPFFLDHGVDYDAFAGAENDPYKPDDLANIPKPIIGFFGAIDNHTSDIKLVEQIVDLVPDMSFVFVGKASSDLSNLAKKSNVWLLGQKPYEQIPHYGKFFDVAIMPWQQNQWIEACNPIKLKEYLALGKPIVSTPFGELQKYADVVYQAKNAAEFADCIKKALRENNRQLLDARRKSVADVSWDRKAQIVFENLFGD